MIRLPKFLKIDKDKRTHYPVCPECGEDTIVLFTPPKEGQYCDGDLSKIDWSRAHIYCCNGKTNCKINTLLTELVTPQRSQWRSNC